MADETDETTEDVATDEAAEEQPAQKKLTAAKRLDILESVRVGAIVLYRPGNAPDVRVPMIVTEVGADGRLAGVAFGATARVIGSGRGSRIVNGCEHGEGTGQWLTLQEA